MIDAHNGLESQHPPKKRWQGSYRENTQFTSPKTIRYLRIDGSTPHSVRHQYISKFNQEEREVDLLFISTRAGGEGINLTGASRVIIFDVSWNPSNDHQAMCRSYRFGQTKPVHIYRLVGSGMMEEHVYNRQVRKEALSKKVIEHVCSQRHYDEKDVDFFADAEGLLKRAHHWDLDEDTLKRDNILRMVLEDDSKWICRAYEQDTLFVHDKAEMAEVIDIDQYDSTDAQSMHEVFIMSDTEAVQIMMMMMMMKKKKKKKKKKKTTMKKRKNRKKEKKKKKTTRKRGRTGRRGRRRRDCERTIANEDANSQCSAARGQWHGSEGKSCYRFDVR